MSHGPPSPPLSPASPLTVPDSLSPPELLRDRTPRPSPSTPSSVADAAPCALRGDVTPEFDVPAAAACPICLLAPLPEPHAEDMAFPCCNAFTHLPCLVRCAQLHGTCPNCRAAIDHLPREPAIAARCEALGINMHAPSAPAPDTAFAVVRDYAMRTFSRGAHPRGMLQSPRRAGARLRGAARRPHALEPAASPRHYRHRSMATTMDVYALPQRAAVGTHLCPGPDPRMPPVLDAYALGGRPRETTQKVGLQPLPLCLYQTTRARGCPTM